MQNTMRSIRDSASSYVELLSKCFTEEHYSGIGKLATTLQAIWTEGKNVFICGNGGSAANALHMANDFHYGLGACGQGPEIAGIKVEALPANQGVVTCLANDIGYEKIFANQLEVKGSEGDLLIVLSGSGNSPNVVNALRCANESKIKTCAIVAFDGGLCKQISDLAIHFEVNDMQIAEDTQLIIGHICMQWLSQNKPTNLPALKNGRGRDRLHECAP